MASLKDVEKLADDLEQLVGNLRSELRSGDFEKLAALADRIGEHADGAAETFSSVNETLARRIDEIRGGGTSGSSGSGRSSGARRKESAKATDGGR